MAYTFAEIIKMFLEGAESGRSGTRTNPGNLAINKNQLLHYSTPIVERTDEGYIVNLSQYSIQTGQLQKQLKEIMKDVPYDVVRKVPRDYQGSLNTFPKQGKEVSINR